MRDRCGLIGEHYHPIEKGKTSASPQGKLDLPSYLASVHLICKLPLCTQDLLAIVLTLCHYAKWRAIERSIYCCLEWKSRRQNCSGAKSNLFMGFHFFLKLEGFPLPLPLAFPLHVPGQVCQGWGLV